MDVTAIDALLEEVDTTTTGIAEREYHGAMDSVRDLLDHGIVARGHAAIYAPNYVDNSSAEPDDVPHHWRMGFELEDAIDRLTWVTTVAADFVPHLRNVHHAGQCRGQACTIHRPSSHALVDFPIVWDQDRRCFQRICRHDYVHPDPDDVTYQLTVHRDIRIHNCDGCCTESTNRPSTGQDVDGAAVNPVTAG